MVKTTDLVADLRVCRHGSCSACGHDCGTAECIDHVIEDAADKIEDLVGALRPVCRGDCGAAADE